MRGRSTTGSISLGIALVAGRKRVPRPATGKTALRMGFMQERLAANDLQGKKRPEGLSGDRSYHSFISARSALRSSLPIIVLGSSSRTSRSEEHTSELQSREN